MVMFRKQLILLLPLDDIFTTRKLNQLTSRSGSRVLSTVKLRNTLSVAAPGCELRHVHFQSEMTSQLPTLYEQSALIVSVPAGPFGSDLRYRIWTTGTPPVSWVDGKGGRHFFDEAARLVTRISNVRRAYRDEWSDEHTGLK